LRKERKLNQVELAEKLYVKQSTVSRWENGIDEPGGDKITDLIALFGCTYDELFMGVSRDNPDERALLNTYRELTDVKKMKIMQLIQKSVSVQEEQDDKEYAQNEIDMLFYLLLKRGLSIGELKLILFDQIERMEDLNQDARQSSFKGEGFTKTIDRLFSRK